jgi:hypothetical protein
MPRDAAIQLEEAPRLPAGTQERFSGYGVLGVGFASGHILGLRRMAASSLGPAFTSVWHRDPGGVWTFYVDAEPERTCGRYFGLVGRVVCADRIIISWQSPNSLSVRVPDARLGWAVHLASSRGARTLGRLRRWVPRGVQERAAIRRSLAAVARHLLGLEGLTLSGVAPSGHRFRMEAHDYWVVDASSARYHGQHLGPPITLRTPARLGGFTIPVWGVFTTGDAFFDDNARRT